MITVRRDQLRRAAGATGIHSDAELARRLNVHPSTLERAMSGKPAGLKFIGGTLKLFGLRRFSELFEVKP
ncbi:hypothetical protein [Mycolicibacterium mageritense]|uniref:Uncharacterized protein n=1 Tax=Mycolicibacterium mageritense TaxID=53462 RepID=A0AAI8TXV9_MYCME|nr:hypothetical protein [Mycolicibacterium mageritense]BDY32988.1 hypothetical protein hbim_06960 [Mycolicibacterium mageritense]